MYHIHQRHHHHKQPQPQQHDQQHPPPPHSSSSTGIWAASPPLPTPLVHGRVVAAPRGALLTAHASGRGGADGAGRSSVSSSVTAAAAVDTSVEEAIHIIDESLSERAKLCDGGLPDAEMCLVEAAEEKPPRDMSVWEEATTRGRWLLGLLVLQSTSSLVLDSYQDLLRDHLVVTLFLTMLVGAGGNAGNQSAIKVIRGLATGAITTSWPSIRATMAEQLEVALLLGAGLSGAGFLRVYLTNGSLLNAAAISMSLVAIVVASVVLGAGLPFALARAGVDPAHAGTSIQVLMDILGVAITCATCQAVLVEFAHGLA